MTPIVSPTGATVLGGGADFVESSGGWRFHLADDLFCLNLNQGLAFGDRVACLAPQGRSKNLPESTLASA